MAMSDRNKTNGDRNMKLFRLCPFWQPATTSSASSSTQNLNHNHNGSINSGRHVAVISSGLKSTTVSSVARSLFPARRRLRLDPSSILYFPFFKFVEQPENNAKQMDQKSNVKFKIVSLKVKGGIEYVPELFDEQKDQVTVERILRVVFLDAEHPTPAMEKLKRQLAEAEAALEARKKPPPDTGPRVVGEGLVIDEWKERREKYLARQHVEAVE
ncbi:hypothetical protein DKX38_017779 [Salix brachista]|uniref:MSP domain-containing protein n=1 Tax=Salix brachista TaxID=2182728 RepID=A0A5N5KW54_9ROSI|nr:hypothetical protein DKX38_017779 [Salix brachista]